MQTAVNNVLSSQTKQWERDVPINLPIIPGEYQYRVKHGWERINATIEK